MGIAPHGLGEKECLLWRINKVAVLFSLHDIHLIFELQPKFRTFLSYTFNEFKYQYVENDSLIV